MTRAVIVESLLSNLNSFSRLHKFEMRSDTQLRMKDINPTLSFFQDTDRRNATFQQYEYDIKNNFNVS